MSDQTQNNVRERALRLLAYLQGLAQIRSKPVRSVKNYEQVLWLHEVPREQPCRTRAWSFDEKDPDIPEDVWLEISKQREPERPPVPELCRDWVDEKSIQRDEGEPRLLEQIVVRVPDPDFVGEEEEDEGEEDPPLVSQTVELSEHPEVEEAFEAYVERKWEPWAEQHRRWRPVQKVYSQLFRIHQAEQRLGEEYELVVGLGLLQWKSGNQESIQRHLITAQASLEFDAERGTLTVRPGADGAKLSVEVDMVDADQRPAAQVSRAELDLAEAGEDPWARETVDRVVRGLTQALDDQGEYHEQRFEPSPQHESRPRVTFAPAVILRKRSVQGLLQTLTTISEQIAAGGEIPPEFIDLAEGEIDREPTAQPAEPGAADPTSAKQYFPLPTNEQQRHIVDKLRATTGVLVQGPPGTGKSHTIANLICHLLATGQRVLVTAQTPRALQVLRDKLPAEIRPLCVSLLGQGAEEQRTLEGSVSDILSRHERWNDTDAEDQVQRLEAEIDKHRRQRVQTDNRIRNILESERRQHSVANDQYRGTAAQIARQVANNEDRFDWISDAADPYQDLPLTADQLLELRDALAGELPDRAQELALRFPDPEADVPTMGMLQDLMKIEEWLQQRLETKQQYSETDAARSMHKARRETVAELARTLWETSKAVGQVLATPHDWIEQAVEAVLTEQEAYWRELHRIFQEPMRDLAERAREADRRKLDIPPDVDRARLRHDASVLLEHFEAGGGTGWLVFKPRVVRQRQYVLDSVGVDGHACDAAAPLRWLLDILNVEADLAQAWRVWEGKISPAGGTYPLQVAELQQHLENLKAVFDVADRVAETRRMLADVENVAEPAWHRDEEITELATVAEAVATSQELQEVKGRLAHWEDRLRHRLTGDGEHEVTAALLAAIENRDAPEFEAQNNRLLELIAAAKRYGVMRERLEKLQAVAPKLTTQLKGSATDPQWLDRLRNAHAAWAWAQARRWLESLFEEDPLESLEREVQRIDKRTNDRVGQLAALRAWRSCFKDLGESERRHLVGWQDAMRRVGKGTGKHAPRHRRTAQTHLNECRTAIPAWIMPLFRVYDTVQAKPGTFDVIIVDEASQCGPESLPLMYLGKQILVVGDDQQISPEAVGVNRDEVISLASTYLHDFKHGDTFEIDSSLFAHAQRRFGNRIVLREHFRCMPEIIRFSNDLCYRQTPLIPLRQYPPERLEPLERELVSDGYREGARERVINQPEAEAIVEKIVACCRDQRYDGKTMGVITLQGKVQAALIEGLLLNELDAEEIEQRRLLCGDPYSFQGDERDVIFISLVAASNERIGPLTTPAARRRFNVAASRAGDQMWLFHSVTRNDLSESDLRRQLLEFFEDPQSQITRALGDEAEALREQAHRANRQLESPPDPFESWFEVDVALTIAARGFRVLPQYPVANKRIDLVVEGRTHRLAVECDGDKWHGIEAQNHDFERQRMLERCGWRFCRIRESAYYANAQKAMEPLWSVLRELTIEPVGSGATASEPDGDKQEQEQPEPDNGDISAVTVEPPGPTLVPEPNAEFDGDSEAGIFATNGKAKPEAEEEPPEATVTNGQHQQSSAAADPPLQLQASQETQQGRLPFDSAEHESDAEAVSRLLAVNADSVEQLTECADAVDATTWLRLSRWAKKRDVLERWQRGLAYGLGRRARQGIPPTEKQAKQGQRLLRSAVDIGFEP